MWCGPSSEGEWKAILGLAVELGVRGNDFVVTRYDRYPRIWFSRTSYGLVYPGNFSEQMSGRIPVPEFISRMYAEARVRNAGKAVEPQVIDAAFVLKRLEALEGAFDRHLQEHRAVTSVSVSVSVSQGGAYTVSYK